METAGFCLSSWLNTPLDSPSGTEEKGNKDVAVRAFYCLQEEGLGKVLEVGGTKGTSSVSILLYFFVYMRVCWLYKQNTCTHVHNYICLTHHCFIQGGRGDITPSLSSPPPPLDFYIDWCIDSSNNMIGIVYVYVTTKTFPPPKFKILYELLYVHGYIVHVLPLSIWI